MTIVHNIIYLIIKSNIVIFVEFVITTCMIIYSFRYSNIITPTMHKDTVYLLDSFLVDNTVFGGRLWWIKYHSQRFSCPCSYNNACYTYAYVLQVHHSIVQKMILKKHLVSKFYTPSRFYNVKYRGQLELKMCLYM